MQARLTLPPNPSPQFRLSPEEWQLALHDRAALKAAVECLQSAQGSPGSSTLVSMGLVHVQKQGFYVYYHGFTTPPEAGIPAGEHLHLYINSRYVKDPVLAASVAKAYRQRQAHALTNPAQATGPFACLCLEIKPYRLDEYEASGANAVRFYDPKNVAAFCADALIEAFATHP
ncbi:MAG: hypothetical protein LBD12_07530 [Clostridiales Family XIII bacterium]|jgi:DNA mismatch repair ATPase MutL|nr:hypothetical protein [Clostridiales Family XIII bacterium]